MRSQIKKTTLTYVKEVMNRMMKRNKTGNMKTILYSSTRACLKGKESFHNHQFKYICLALLLIKSCRESFRQQINSFFCINVTTVGIDYLLLTHVCPDIFNLHVSITSQGHPPRLGGSFQLVKYLKAKLSDHGIQ